jgi:hypothetical protein
MIDRDFNHPSIIIWTLVNEDWGTALPLMAADRAWLGELYTLCKTLDPTRLVVDNSACPTGWGPNIHIRSDIDDFHTYTNIPDQAQAFTDFIENFALRPLWTFSSHGEAQRTGGEPLILSEFGNWGLPTLSNLQDADGHEPHWFDRGPWWSGWDGEPGWPAGVRERFERLGLGALWASYDAFAEATQWHQFAAMRYEIEAMRRQPTLAGYVITEFTDAYWESNGLLDFNRCPKVYHREFAAINAPDVIVPKLERYATWDDQPLPLELHIAHYSDRSWTGAQISMGANSKQPVALNASSRGTVQSIGTFSVTPPTVEKTEMLHVPLSVQDSAGKLLAHNQIDVMVLPSAVRAASYHAPLAVLSRPHESAVGTTLRALGYQTTAMLSSQTALAFATHLTAESLAWLRAGGKLLYCASGPGPFFWLQSRGGSYGGSWITTFNWLRPDIFPRLSVQNPITLPYITIAPHSVILGLPYDDPRVQSDFLAGQIAGWLQHPALHAVQFRYGEGTAIMTTFNFGRVLGDGSGNPDPVGVAMLHDLIDHLASERCQPTLQANF